jgi:hypothetical protein
VADHLDFRGGVFNEPFVGKSVTQVTQTVTTLARPDDKMYIVMRSDFYDYGEDAQPVGAAMSMEKANIFVRSYVVEGATLTAHEHCQRDGSWYRHFEFDPSQESFIERVAIYVAVVPTI